MVANITGVVEREDVAIVKACFSERVYGENVSFIEEKMEQRGENGLSSFYSSLL
jgi:hypothetical protein